MLQTQAKLFRDMTSFKLSICDKTHFLQLLFHSFLGWFIHKSQQRKIRRKCCNVKSGKMTVGMLPCARGTVPGLLVGACLLHTHHFPPVSMHTCQREVGNPLLIVPFGTWYMPWISGRAGYLQKSTKLSLQPTPTWVKAWKLYCKWIIAFLLFLFKAGKKKSKQPAFLSKESNVFNRKF